MKPLKVTALILALITVFSACSTAKEEIVPEYEPDKNSDDIDLMGYEFKIAAGASSLSLDPVPGSDVRGDKLLQRYKDTEEKYNVDITVKNSNDPKTFLAEFAADRRYADLMLQSGAGMFGGKYVQNGYCMAFSDMDIDLHSGLYGTSGALESGFFNGKYYTVNAYYWGFPTPYTMPAMWFNPRVLTNYQQANPHELIEQGEWTWDTLEKMCEAIRDTSDPNKENHVYALAYTSEPYLEFAALYSNNARIVNKGADGRLTYALNSKEALEALSFTRSLAEKQLICDGGDRQNITPFVENRRAFFLEFTHLGLSSESTSNFSYLMEEAYEWLYFPTGPSGDMDSKQRTSFSYHSVSFFAPINSDIEIQSILLPYLFQPLPGETEENWQDDFERNTFFTNESFEYFQILRDEAFYDYTGFIPYAELQSSLLDVTKGRKSASETLISLEPKMQGSLDELYNDYLD